MKRFLFVFILLCIAASYFIFKHQTSFEVLMGRDSPHWAFVNTNEDKRRIKFYKSLYSKYFPRANPNNSSERHIPHVIHFIWVGPRDFPDASIKNLESWKAWHPGWKIKLWTDRQRDLSVQGIEQTLIDKDNFPLLGNFVDKTTNFGEKSDLLRYEILYTQGGIYVDHDVFCYHSFQSLHDNVDFITVLEKPHRDVGFDSSIVPAICLIGSRQGHLIMKTAIENVVECWDRVENEYADRPFLRVVNRTFRSFGEAVIKQIGRTGMIDLPLPSSFLFAEEIFTPSKIRALKKKNYIFGSHSWDISWMRGTTSLPDETYQHLQQNFRQHFLAKAQLKSIEKKIWVLLPASLLLIVLMWRKRGLL